MRNRRRITNPSKSPFSSPKAVVQQHMAAESDINQIVARARRGIAPTNVREGQPRYLDLSDSPQSLTEAYERVQAAEDAFYSLPARARDELGNDPVALLSANREFFERHGLLSPVEAVAAPSSTAVSEPAEAPAGAAATRTASKAGSSKVSKESSVDHSGKD